MKKMIRIYLCSILSLLSVLSAGAQTLATSSSPVSLTDNNGHIGMTLQPSSAAENDTIWTLTVGEEFSVTCGTLYCSSTFSGEIAVILVRDNALVAILSSQSLTYKSSMIGNTYFTCCLNDDIEVLDGDVIRLATTTDGSTYNIIRGSSTAVTAQIQAVNYTLPLYHINLPETISGATLRIGDTNLFSDKVVRGRNFIFYVEPDNDNMTVIVKANSETVAPSGYMYTLSYVLQDYDIDIRIYDLSTAVTFHKINVSESVRISDLLTQEEMDCTTYLVVTGEMKDEDFYTIRDCMPILQTLDLTQATAENNYVPEYALNYNVSISKLFLPQNIEGFGNDAFREMQQLTSIILPETLCHFGLNQFYGCPKLTTVWVKWNPFDHGETLGFTIPPCAFRSTSYETDGVLIVPTGCVEAYRNAANWGNFATIREPYPIDELVYATDEVTAEKPAQVTTENGAIVVKPTGSEPVQIMVYNLNGRALYQATFQEETRISLPRGFYIVSVNRKCEKIIIP
ncbi:MAG: leucine-rich repeat domain-containing protein [Porphyromonadaceae bacterium]|nr:leucine-rich repeat domain-containing protein [Porphyromonadaceae bacterium]